MKRRKISNEFIKIIRNMSSKKRLALHEPFFFGNEKKLLSECINNTFISTKSKFTSIFEKEISKYTKSKYSIAITSGTAALHMCLVSINIKDGEEVFLPSFNFIAAANAIKYCNASPHFLDIDKETFSIDPKRLEFYLKKNFIIKDRGCFNSKTKKYVRAIIVPHIFGHPARIETIKKIIKKYKIYLIEDAAESLGSFYKKKHTGTFGHLGVLSFNGNKIITTGAGGAILTDNFILQKKIRKLIQQSKVNHNWKFDYSDIGYNLKMPGLNAALGIAQIKNIKKIVNLKRKINLKYQKEFKNNNLFKLVKEPKFCRSNYWLNCVILKTKDKNLKDYIINESNNKGIMTRPAWSLLHKVKHLKNCPKDNLQNSEEIYNKIISIPSSPNLI